MIDNHDPYNPAQRREIERLVAEANARHKVRAQSANRSEMSGLQSILADELRAAYEEGKKAKEEVPDADVAGL